jgi:hypothetical protein
VGYGDHDRAANRELLRELASVLGSEPWVVQVDVFPANQPESIVVRLLDQHYPEQHVADAYFEVQSYTNGDFHITYVENQYGEEWLCRWDRHDSEAYGRDHFHAPPSARHEDGERREYPQSLFDVLSQEVVPWIFDRIGDVWDDTGP